MSKQQTHINNVINANKQLHKANMALYNHLKTKIHTLIKTNNIKSIETLMEILPECFTKYTLFLHLDRIKSKKKSYT